MSTQLTAFLDMLAWSEIGPDLLAKSDRGYNVVVGSTPQKPILFASYAAHPRIRSEAFNSDAAGRYQFLGRYWDHYRKQLKLADFSPISQDKWAVQLIRECGALEDIEVGWFDVAVNKCRSRWASLPGAGYGQRENKLADLRAAFVAAGGRVA
jgi:muramidase (phage lysozyme)